MTTIISGGSVCIILLRNDAGHRKMRDKLHVNYQVKNTTPTVPRQGAV